MSEAPWAVAVLLDKRKPKTKNILLGSDRVVLKALEKKYKISIKPYALEEPQTFSYVDRDSQVPIAEHPSCTFWRNPPITRNKELLAYITSVMAPDMKEAERTPITNSFVFDTESIRDFDILYWRVRTAISAKVAGGWDKQPWDTAMGWLGSTPPDIRLARLYHDLRAYIYIKLDNKPEIKTLGVSAGKIKYLSGLNLSNKRIADTFGILAQWRYQTLNGQQAAFLVSTTWSMT